MTISRRKLVTIRVEDPSVGVWLKYAWTGCPVNGIPAVAKHIPEPPGTSTDHWPSTHVSFDHDHSDGIPFLDLSLKARLLSFYFPLISSLLNLTPDSPVVSS